MIFSFVPGNNWAKTCVFTQHSIQQGSCTCTGVPVTGLTYLGIHSNKHSLCVEINNDGAPEYDKNGLQLLPRVDNRQSSSSSFAQHGSLKPWQPRIMKLLWGLAFAKFVKTKPCCDLVAKKYIIQVCGCVPHCFILFQWGLYEFRFAVNFIQERIIRLVPRC